MKLKKTIGTVISICLIAGFAMIPKAEAAWGVSQPENTTGAETDMKQYFELRFYDTYGTVTVCREYLEPVLGGKEPGISEYSAKVSSGPETVEDGTDTHLEETILESVGVPEPDIPEGCQFLGWLNCTGINEAELEAIYGDSLENNSYLCKDTGKARAYLVNEDDLTEGPMDLYAAYASLDAEKDTNLEEAGTEENSNINIPVYAQADVIVESNIDHVLGDNAENYRYMEESGETGNITLYADMVIESPAWTEAIEHPEEYHMEYIEHPEEYHYEQKLIYQCNGCKEKFTSYEDARKHNKEQMLAGNFACGGHSSFMDDVKVVDKEAWTEEVKVVDKEAWTETVIVKEAWDEQVLVKEAWDEQVLVKEAWDEQVLVSPEEGHWEKVETEEPVDPDQPDTPEEPTTPDQSDTPDNPVDPEIPADPDNGGTDTEVTDTEKPDGTETPVITDTEAAGTNNAPAAEQGNKNTRSGGVEATGNKSSGGSSSTVPKTGDPAALGSLITLAGGALASGSAVVWKVKRKK